MPQNLSSPAHPWQLTRNEWDAERERLRPDVAQSRFTRTTSSQMASKSQRLQWLIGDVRRNDREQLARAGRGEIAMSAQDVEDALDRINTPVRHQDVVAWALAVGFDVPANVLRDYTF